MRKVLDNNWNCHEIQMPVLKTWTIFLQHLCVGDISGIQWSVSVLSRHYKKLKSIYFISLSFWQCLRYFWWWKSCKNNDTHSYQSALCLVVRCINQLWLKRTKYTILCKSLKPPPTFMYFSSKHPGVWFVTVVLNNSSLSRLCESPSLNIGCFFTHFPITSCIWPFSEECWFLLEHRPMNHSKMKEPQLKRWTSVVSTYKQHLSKEPRANFYRFLYLFIASIRKMGIKFVFLH